MSSQSRRIAAVLASKDGSDLRGWLARLGVALAGEATLDRETISDLVDRGRPRWGVRTRDDGAAYVELWADLVRRYPDPRLIAGYSDVLYLLGGRERACEALTVFFEAVRRDPPVYHRVFRRLLRSLGAMRSRRKAGIRARDDRVLRVLRRQG
jgi:hypothetical protein